MKNINLLSLALLILISFSCKKDNNDNDPVKPKTKMELMTGKTWMYDEYLRGYNISNTVVYYKRGKPNNLLNWDQNRVTFRTDGTYTEITPTGGTISGTWRFLNNETQYEVTNSLGTWTTTFMTLEENKLTWLVPNVDNGTLGKMIPQ